MLNPIKPTRITLSLLAAISLFAVGVMSACDNADGPAWSGPGDLSGSADDGGNGSEDGGSDASVLCGQPTGACATCLQAKCPTQMSDCFGMLWPNGDIHGTPCDGVFACNCACQAADGGSSCLSDCVQQSATSCQSCYGRLTSCVTMSCSAQCEN